MGKCFIRPLGDNPFRGVLPRATQWEVFFSIENKIVEADGSFQINFSKEVVKVLASDRNLAISEAKKLVSQWKGCVTGARKA